MYTDLRFIQLSEQPMHVLVMIAIRTGHGAPLGGGLGASLFCPLTCLWLVQAPACTLYL